MLSERVAYRLTLLRLMPYFLLHFLIKKHILTQYVGNVLNYTFSIYEMNRVKRIAVWVRFIRANKQMILWDSFNWSKTPEGEDFLESYK